MAMAFQWHTHPDVSPFVPLGQAIAPQLGALQQRANFPGSMVPQPVSSVGGTSRAPDSMQVDDSGGAPVTGGSRPAASSSAPGPSGTAGPSGVQPGATSDAQMVEGRAPRKHVDAPMRKLSVSLIDTYKLINQVRENPALQHSRRGGGGCAGDVAKVEARWRALTNRASRSTRISGLATSSPICTPSIALGCGWRFVALWRLQWRLWMLSTIGTTPHVAHHHFRHV